jgi:hypothetical protein
MMLAVENRQATDSRTLGEIFYLVSDELSDITWVEAFHMIIQIFMETISDKLSLTSKQLDQLMDSFLLALPKQFKGSLGLCI